MLMYTSLIRPKNHMRGHFNTTLSKELLDQIKQLAIEKDTSYNFLLEEGMEWVMETYYLKGSFIKLPVPEDRVRINTTFDKSLFNRLRARGYRLSIKGKQKVYANDLIEEGMKYVLGKYEKDRLD